DEYVFEVYRGDYIVFSFQDNELHNIRIPELEIDAELPKPSVEKPYLKMKVVGTFDIYIDDARGTISVLQYDEPQYKEITSQEAAALIENIEPLILDVRTGPEFAEGHLSNAVLLPVQELESRLGEVFTNKDAPIFVYCKSGNRSTVASKILIDNGFTNVINLRHGILEWQKEDLPIVAP
ncbi:MAG: rhodanese-like domain-containing protein, partial [Spirochaetales bacterium]|nr:rhodanese-like domain-containing protein [Spirochaetales bacterium]